MANSSTGLTLDRQGPILVVGNTRQAHNVAICLANAGQQVVWYRDKAPEASNGNTSYGQTEHYEGQQTEGIAIVRQLPIAPLSFQLAIAVSEEDLVIKEAILAQLEKHLPSKLLIAINTESVPLSYLQSKTKHPDRIIGLNWAEPAYTTAFLEVIINEANRPNVAAPLLKQAREHWQKDPYLINGDLGIRARLISALIREAFYLVDNGYASFEDIDRACRNDAGYYLPFAGNFRYMDLMGTYAYGMVMKDLNPELSKSRELPAFFTTMVEEGQLGMDQGRGFYDYQEGEGRLWNELFVKFSHRLRELMKKYPFNYEEATDH